MELVACAGCGSEDHETLFEGSDYNSDSEKKFQLVRCRSCGLVFVNPRPTGDEIGSYYAAEYYGEKNLRFNPVLEFIIKCFRRGRAKKVLRYRGKGTILDIGCGRGHMLSILKSVGWDVLGTELSKESSAFAREVLGLEVIEGDIEKICLESESFDVVTMWHVFEHLPHPDKVLSKISNMLKEDGTLIISVPNFGSLQSGISGARWFHLDVPRHLYHYTPESLEMLLRRNGFRSIRTKYSSPEYNYFGMIQSLYNILGLRPNYLYNLIRREGARLGDGGKSSLSSFILTVMLAPLVFPAGILLSLILDRTRLGGNLEIHALKAE